MTKPWLATCLLALATLGSAVPANASTAGDGLRLRVVTWNVWGAPWITPDIDGRMAAVAPALLALEPDVVLLQEVWRVEDGWLIGSMLQDGGLPHIRHYEGAARSSGLMVASRYPILDDRFEPFTLGNPGYNPIHLDWMCNKGLARLELDTPVGPVVIGATHMQGGYALDAYPVVRLSQALEAADALGDDGHPVIVGGDLNSPSTDFPFEIFASRAGVTPTAERFDLDSLFARSGRDVTVKVEATRRLLEDPRPLPGGGEAVLSDHPAILSDVLLMPTAGGTVPAARDPKWPALRARAHAALSESHASTTSQTTWARIGGFALLVLLGVLVWRTRGPTRIAGGLVVAALLAWLAWFGFVYGPEHSEGLARMTESLGVPGAP